MNSHPFAKIFAPVVFLSLALHSAGFSFGPAHAQGPASPIAAPGIERFDLDPPSRLVPGEAMIFRITGTSNGIASVRIDGVNGKVALHEVMPGIYEGAYTLRRGDRIDADSAVTGILRFGNNERTAVLRQPLVDATTVATSR